MFFIYAKIHACSVYLIIVSGRVKIVSVIVLTRARIIFLKGKKGISCLSRSMILIRRFILIGRAREWARYIAGESKNVIAI